MSTVDSSQCDEISLNENRGMNVVNSGEDSIFNENYEFSTNTCYLCNGYYGPCFEEPICATCHAFLFPDIQFCPYLSYNALLFSHNSLFSENGDDSDSGNDEPTDQFNMLEKPDRVYVRAQPCRNKKQKGIKKVDLLTQQINYLTTPRQADDLSPNIVQCLPDEVLYTVFSYLDDLSLWCVGNVCKRWRDLMKTHTNDDAWKEYTLKRWPLFKPIANIDSWFKLFSKLIESSPCKACLQNMSLQSLTKQEVDSWRNIRLRSELKSLQADPLEGFHIIPLDFNFYHWQATIIGPVGSPFEGGLFFIHLQVPYGYPLCPPVVRFLTKIFHPNVSRHGDVSIDSLAHNWSLALTISKVLISVQSLLTDPYCQVCMEPEIGALYLRDKATYENIARAWTWRYAMHDVIK